MEIIFARCKTASTSLPKQIEDGTLYLVSVQSIHKDSNDNICGDVYDLHSRFIGRMKLGHFLFENVITGHQETMLTYLHRSKLIQ